MNKRKPSRKPDDTGKAASQIREWADAFGLAAVVLIILYFAFWPMKIDGMSMEDNYHSGDRIAISRLLKYVSKISRSDVIVCVIRDEAAGKDIRVIKRVIGVPGDQVRITEGKVYVNGEALDENYTKTDYTHGEVEIMLDQECYFVLGDNRDVSYDSRMVGPIGRKQVVGKVFMRFYRQQPAVSGEKHLGR